MMVQDVELGLKRSENISFTMLEKVLMVMEEVDIDLRPALSDDLFRSLGFYIYGNDRSGHRSQTIRFISYNHGGLYIYHPRFTQEAIARGAEG